jgi:hypothetical protein
VIKKSGIIQVVSSGCLCEMNQEDHVHCELGSIGGDCLLVGLETGMVQRLSDLL